MRIRLTSIRTRIAATPPCALYLLDLPGTQPRVRPHALKATQATAIGRDPESRPIGNSTLIPEEAGFAALQVMGLGDSTRNSALTRTNSKSVAHDRPINSAPPRRSHMATQRHPPSHRQDPESSRPINARDRDLPIRIRCTRPPRLPEDPDRCSAASGCPLWADVRSRLADATSNSDSLQTI